MGERKGLWTPMHILDMVRDGKIDHTDALMLGVVVYYEEHGRYGCRVTNDWFAETLNIDVRNVSKRLKWLRGEGYIKSVRDGRRRTLLTEGSAKMHSGEKNTEKRQKIAFEGRTRPSNIEVAKATMSGNDAGRGFGFEGNIKKTNTTDFDKAVASKLLEAVKTQPPRKTWIGSARPTTWAKHITTLRTKDGATEEQITTAIEWYATRIGEEFVPVAYSGESFRKKFAAIYRQAEKAKDENTTPGKDALAIAARFKGAGWLNGSAQKLPSAIQVNIDRYKEWRAQIADFKERATKDDLVCDYDPIFIKRRIKAATALLERMPKTQTYATAWAERTLKRVRSWDEWSGDFRPFLFGAKEEKIIALKAMQSQYGEGAGLKEFEKLKKILADESN